MNAIDQSFSPSLECARFVASTAFKDLPQAVTDFVKKDLLDWLGGAIAGAVNTASEPIKKVETLLGGNSQASIIGMGSGNVQFASMCNAYFGSITDSDDVDRESITHPGAVTLPPALALAEFLKKDGKELITSIACGFEVMLRIGAAITPEHYKVFHTTATTRVFGAAMTSGKLLGLTEVQLLWALGNAGTSSAGLWQFLANGAMSDLLHTANAAGNGMLSALLASNGFSGATRILEGEKGFFAGYARQEPKLELFKDFGKTWRTDKVSFRPYPCCRHTHSAIDAALDIRDKLYGQKPVEIRLATYGTANTVAGKRAPTNGRDAKFSLSYCVASALARGKPSQKDFLEAQVTNPDIQALESLVKIEESDELNAALPKCWPARLEVKTDNGETFTSEVWNPKGDPENPVGWRDLAEKFVMLTEDLINPVSQLNIVSMCNALDQLNDPAAMILKEVNSNLVNRS
ncbi:MAG: MmgE/PrpD family protein [Burkholderiales bacterium]|nr:MmgE/PrpD family protein [Burkholderiales bacterium]